MGRGSPCAMIARQGASLRALVLTTAFPTGKSASLLPGTRCHPAPYGFRPKTLTFTLTPTHAGLTQATWREGERPEILDIHGSSIPPPPSLPRRCRPHSVASDCAPHRGQHQPHPATTSATYLVAA